MERGGGRFPELLRILEKDGANRLDRLSGGAERRGGTSMSERAPAQAVRGGVGDFFLACWASY